MYTHMAESAVSCIHKVNGCMMHFPQPQSKQMTTCTHQQLYFFFGKSSSKYTILMARHSRALISAQELKFL